MGTHAEAVKEASAGLRGTLAEDLASDAAAFVEDNRVLLKFHGIYQQDDRDVRSERTRARRELDYICMVRTAIPGGVLTADQYLAMDGLTELGNGTLRVTTRQGAQFHFTRKGSLQPLLHALNESLVTTLGACGDLVRNVACCPAPSGGRETADVQSYARALATRLRPRTSSYYDLWIDGEQAVSAPRPRPHGGPDEPLYGTTYLPRKFKIGMAWPGDNCVDVYSHDVGIVPQLTDGAISGFTLLVGGGLGRSQADDTTYPRVASPLCSVAPDELVDVVEEVVRIHRDHGNRDDRDHARLKYVVDAWGVPRFKAELETRLGRPLADPGPLAWQEVGGHTGGHLGWHRADDGSWFLGLAVRAGRISDTEEHRLRSGLRAVVERFRPGVRFTARQDVLLTGIADDDRGEVHRLLADHGVTLADELHGLDRQALACPALPTCGLALAEAERALPDVLAQVHRALDEAGVPELAPALSMTGCPNGCARPYTAEIGIMGRAKRSYDVHLGGDPAGTRLTTEFARNVPRDKLGTVLRPVFAHYRQAAHAGESFGDFCHREGVASLRERFGDESWVRPSARGAAPRGTGARSAVVEQAVAEAPVDTKARVIGEG